MPNQGQNLANTAAPNNVFQKLAGFQSLIPEFDNISAVTPQYFLDSIENITAMVHSSDQEKLIILKSRLRGDPLTHIINSPDFANETNFNDFKAKFLDYFTTKTSLATRQQQFSHCRMSANEPAKIYASRVANSTLKFLGDVNLSNPDVKSLFEQTKLSKFIDGLLPQYKQSVLTKDPQTFQEALNFVELLQANEAYFPQTGVHNIQNSQTQIADIAKLLETHSQNTHETIAALSNDIQKLKLDIDNTRPPTNSFQQRTFRSPHRAPQSHRSFQNNRHLSRSSERISNTQPTTNRNRNITCGRCFRLGHTSDVCYARTPQNPSPRQYTNSRHYGPIERQPLNYQEFSQPRDRNPRHNNSRRSAQYASHNTPRTVRFSNFSENGRGYRN